ncbi:hypothetical protein, partial [Methylacidimicrobium cyclopophantes]|uniref:hypothetical protein n=1 Tax=Methylacidimicrobium cyclopophantes TaxID=1041766 RepID=UPI001C49B622
LTPVQREATYELVDLNIKMDSQDTPLEQRRKELFALFARWGPKKFRSFLADRWLATEFLMDLELSLNLHPNPKNPDHPSYVWDLSAMPSWFWQEIAEFVEGPNAYPAFSAIALPWIRPLCEPLEPLHALAATLKDKKMEQALHALAEKHPELRPGGLIPPFPPDLLPGLF